MLNMLNTLACGGLGNIDYLHAPCTQGRDHCLALAQVLCSTFLPEPHGMTCWCCLYRFHIVSQSAEAHTACGQQLDATRDSTNTLSGMAQPMNRA